MGNDVTSPIRVLLVEDNPGDADLTRETLQDGKLRVHIDVVTDGTRALDFLLRRPPFADAKAPDLILLDLNLPKMGGREVLAEISRHEALRVIPVVVLTSSEAEQDVARSYELGANCYVTKPVGLEAFQAIVHAIESFWFTVVKLP
jgi:CheY-like chemotaxis protein